MTPKPPKYETIKQFLIHGIASQTFTDAMPSENQLAESFGVSRMTARRALDELEREGSVARFPGKGTFVRKTQHYTRGFFRVRPFRKWAADINVTLTTVVLEAELIEPPSNIAKKLQTEDPVVLLRILNSFDDKPVRYAVRYLVADPCARILAENLEQESIHDILINRYGLPLTRISQSMTAIGLSPEIARIFNTEPGYPAFYFQRLTFSFDQPITYVEYTMRGEMAFDDTFTPKLDPADFFSRDKLFREF
jgi:GntR family transcriptional regulator